MRLRLAALTIALAMAGVVRVTTGSVTGVVRSVTRAGGSPALAVVYAEPIDSPAPRAPKRLTLTQKNKTFQPRVLAVPVGSTVEFPNNDGLYHNVFSLSSPQPFDLGLYRSGESPSRTFTAPGIYRVFCNIHPQMSAVLVVAPTAYVAAAASDGRYMLDLPTGPLSRDGGVGAGGAGVGGSDEHARRIERAGAHAGRVAVDRRAAQEQVREGLSRGGV